MAQKCYPVLCTATYTFEQSNLEFVFQVQKFQDKNLISYIFHYFFIGLTFLCSVSLTEYVAIDARVYVFVSVCLCHLYSPNK